MFGYATRETGTMPMPIQIAHTLARIAWPRFARRR